MSRRRKCQMIRSQPELLVWLGIPVLFLLVTSRSGNEQDLQVSCAHKKGISDVCVNFHLTGSRTLGYGCLAMPVGGFVDFAN